MYNNIGEKIKNLAIVFFIIEAIITIIFGCIFLSEEGPVGLIIILVGPVLSFVSSWLTYGFGELIVKTTEIALNTSGSKTKIDYERLARLTKLREEGLLTETEYQQALSKNIS